ncbi:MAG: hypothetical protein RIS36_2310 [Pseudomonadota bacterium]|jgi:hypothetical protein
MSGFKSDGSDNRRIERALQHVVRPWFPINQDVLTSIRKNLDEGSYTSAPQQLLNDLKADFALFTFVVKELGILGMQEKIPQKILNSPIELIRWGGLERMKDILAPDKKLPATHSLHWSEPFQVARLRETAVIASTAAVLSEKKDLDPEVGFSRGVIREIGLNLIAWNYPSLYSKVLNNLKPDSTLDEELSKELGFTPSLLAMRVLRPENPDQPEGTFITDETSWAAYDELCEVGEALARAENPETYPSAQNDWEKANQYLTENAGTGALELIKERAVEQAKRYQEALPEVFNSLENFNPKRNIDVHARMKAVIADQDFRVCPPHVQEALRTLYNVIDGYAVNKSAIQTLLKSIIPQAGFTGGCVFVIDPSTASLKPRTIIGQVNLRAITNVSLDPGDLAVAALGAHGHLFDVKEDAQPLPLEGIYSALGEQRKVGVLYLETPKTANEEPEGRTIGTYNILKRALCDVLNLK